MTRELGDARLVYVRYLTRGRVTHDEVLCRRCHDTMAAQGAFDERAPGQRIDVRPWTGDDECWQCTGAANGAAL